MNYTYFSLPLPISHRSLPQSEKIEEKIKRKFCLVIGIKIEPGSCVGKPKAEGV